MKYHDITHDDMKNGDGLRVVLWVSGCDHHCPGCQNPVTWDPNDGKEFDFEALQEIDEEMKKDYISGLTLSGGDPFHENNLLEVLGICRFMKNRYPDKTIWVYTGYTWESLKERMIFPREILDYVDVLVDGEFEMDKLDVNYPWAGSTNQRVIDVQESLKQKKVVLHESNQERWNAGDIRQHQNCNCCE